MIHFSLAKHRSRDVQVVEIWENGEFVGMITPGDCTDERSIRIISKHFYRVGVGELITWPDPIIAEVHIPR